ncbi:fatty acyl-CoA reductase 1 [Nasonia vitripennis]|uniref:Fatty acyl-CoA reductase n=1 Tax=Nasonia vitripennis TaxID=7425 RepID=A0A7M7T9D2_NASVI|nr:fatty acyl-CoA reductase 1 [Nasonia vitripennis]XP_031784431.1 fatty acyl-CoA reductase 1 [Nasonia vitripennis]XP_031784439.1 fatty acyl-CoA reductase 1 [Nasonia vitripennis]
MGTTNAQSCETMAEKRSASQRRAEEKAKVEASEAEQRGGNNNNNNNGTESVSSVLGSGGPGSSCSAVEAFYAEAIILVTGATGFLGKALLEKLLRSCSRLSTIFVLIRPKKGRTMEQRFTELIENPVFDRLRWECPSALSKLFPIKGDVGMPELGLSLEDRTMLMQRVNIVFHSAATVRFNEPIKTAVNLNTRGTDRIIDLCKGMANLACLIHVSTAYSNADLRDIQEMVYSTKVKPQTLMDMCENLDDETMGILEKKLLGKHPNTYTLTKGLAEQVVLTKGVGLPAVAIVRPSIVCAAFQEPFPGWVDNVCGITGILMEIGRGTMRSIVCQPQCIVDIVPVDYVVDTLICTAWHITTSRPQRFTNSDTCALRVYNCTSGGFNPVKWGEIGDMTRKYAIESPTKYVMWYPHVTYRSSQFFHKIAVAILHFLPAFVIDIILRFRGSKPQMIKMTKRTMRAAKSGEFFAVNEWYFHAENMKELVKCIKNSGVDGSTPRYNVDITNLDWETYVRQYVLGIRKYVLKDSPDTLGKARSKLYKLYWIRRITQLFSLYVLVKIVTRASAR